MKKSNLVVCNVPVPDPNPVETSVSLLDAISTPDVHNHDDLPYPTGVEISMEDYSNNGNTSTTMQDKYVNHIKEKYGLEIVQPSEQLLIGIKTILRQNSIMLQRTFPCMT